MATIKDVAKACGVSVATVSRVMNDGPKVGEETRARVKQVMIEMGYRRNEYARALVTKNNATVGVVIPDITDPFFAQLAKGADTIARKRKMQLLLSTGEPTQQSEREAIELLLDRRCEIIIAHSKKLPDHELIALSEKVKGLVIINRHIEAISDRCVWLDNYMGGQVAADHLAKLGHTDIACVFSQYDIDDPKLRLSGFQLKYQNLYPQQAIPKVEYASPDHVGGQLATEALLRKGVRFSALFAYNDAMAIGAISALEEHGLRVPQDVSVIGFDDGLLASYTRPKLTTIHYPIAAMAEEAVALAIALSEEKGEITETTHHHQPYLVKRASTRAINDNSEQ